MSVLAASRQLSHRPAPFPKGLLAGAAVAGLAIATGFAESRSPVYAAVPVGVVLLAAGALLGGRVFVATVTLAALPWMVIFNDLMPPLLKTFTSAAATIAVCACVVPMRPRNAWLPVGIFLFLAAAAYGTVTAAGSAALTVAPKYLVFPIMVLAITSRPAPERLPRLLTPVLVSSALAMAVQLGIVVLGLGAIGTYYHVGEHLGFDSADPLELGLMGVVVACGGLAAYKRTGPRVLFLLLGLIPAFETGNRSALLASVLVVLIFMVNSRFRLSHVVVVAAVAAVLIGSGVLAVAENRISTDIQSGEFSSFSTAGSGRGEIWTIALSHYFASGPIGLVLGTGLGSIPRFEQQAVGLAFVGHSDVLEVGIQLGLIGFAGWIIIWLVLLTDAWLSRIVLIPLAVYALVTGSIEATAPVAVALFFAAATPSLAVADLLPSPATARPDPRLHEAQAPRVPLARP